MKKLIRNFKPLPLPSDMTNETMDAIVYTPAKTEDVQAAITAANEQHEESLQELAEE